VRSVAAAAAVVVAVVEVAAAAAVVEDVVAAAVEDAAAVVAEGAVAVAVGGVAAVTFGEIDGSVEGTAIDPVAGSDKAGLLAGNRWTRRRERGLGSQEDWRVVIGVYMSRTLHWTYFELIRY
jgi:opacity protein-like surface antigen